MPGQVVADGGLLVLQALGVRPFARRDEADEGSADSSPNSAPARRSPRRARLPRARCPRRRAGRPGALYRVERTRADQRLDRAPVHEALVHAPAEIEEVAERSACRARGDDRLDGRLAVPFTPPRP